MKIGLRLIGSGFTSKARAPVYEMARAFFGDLSKINLAGLWDSLKSHALTMVERLGFAKTSSIFLAFKGCRTVFSGPEHLTCGERSQASGRQIGSEDLKRIEAAFLRAIAASTPSYPDFTGALACERAIHAIDTSPQQG